MRRLNLTSEEEDFLDQIRQVLLERPRASAITAEQAGRILEHARSVLHTPEAFSGQVGEVCRTGAVCDWLGISRQAVSKAVKDQRILGFQTLDGKWIYPVWQFEAPETYAACVQGLPPVLDVLESRGISGFEAAVWFAASNPTLGHAPFETFQTENPAVDALIQAAKKAKPPAKPRLLPRLSEIFGDAL